MRMRLASYGDQLRRESRAYPWKDTLLRMAIDVLLTNVSLVSAFALWFLFYVIILRAPDPQKLAELFKGFVTQDWLFWSFLALLVFQLNGLYPHTRGTRGAQKAIVVFRAVSLFIVLFVFADYFLFRGMLVPRGVALVGWLLMLMTVGGSRLAKHRVLRLYNVELKADPAKVKKILVLGGAGYLGSVLAPLLLSRGFMVRILDSFLFGEKSLDEVKAHPNCEVIRGDVRDIGAVVQSMRGCDAVVDLAAIVGDSACEENKQLALEVNCAATRMLVDIARGYVWPAEYSGRALINCFSQIWHGREDALIAAGAAERRRYAVAAAAGDVDTALVFAGEGTDLIHDIEPAEIILHRIVTEAEAALAQRFN